MHDDSVVLSLTQDEALILFEMLSRYDDTERLAVQDESEELALWRLHAQLQKSLITPFAENYAELLGQARGRLAAQAGGA